jgi:hypothetical protein
VVTSPRKAWACGALVLQLLAGTACRAQAVSEPVVKAGFVYNFAKFTEWPPATLPNGGPVQLCLVAGDPQGAVAAAMDGKQLQGRALVVRRQVRPDELHNCHIVYLTDTDERHQGEALRAIRGLPVLSIGDGDGFAEVGGMIGLVAVGERIQFEVNADVARAAGLKISSQLLRLARTVRGKT